MQECCAKAVLSLTQLVKEQECGSKGILDPVHDLKVNDIDCVKFIDELKKLEEAVVEYKCTKCPEFEKHVCVYVRLYIYVCVCIYS